MDKGLANVRIGTPVYTADGIELGKVVMANQHYLVVERGWLIRHGLSFRWADPGRDEQERLVLRLTSAQVDERFRRRPW